MPDYGPKKNSEGYNDPTAYEALRNINRKEAKEADALRRANALIGAIRSIVDLAGFDLLCRIQIRDRKTGREFL